MNSTKRPCNHKKGGSWIPGSQLFADLGAFYSSMLVGLMHNSTTSKEQQNAQLIPSKVSPKLVLSLLEWKKIGKMVENFCFCPLYNSFLPII